MIIYLIAVHSVGSSWLFSTVLFRFESLHDHLSNYAVRPGTKERSWAEVQSATIDTSRSLHIIVIKKNLSTIAYFAQKPITRRGSQNNGARQNKNKTFEKFVENILGSVKKFHSSGLFKQTRAHVHFI